MPNLKIKDGDGNPKFIRTNGAGTDASPYQTETKTEIILPLPAGTNNIGKFDIASLPANLIEVNQLKVSQKPLTDTIDSVSAKQAGTWQVILGAGTNNIGNVGIASFPVSLIDTNQLKVSQKPLTDTTDSIAAKQLGNWQVALLSSNSNIGRVEVTNFPAAAPIPAGTNTIGKVEIVNPISNVDINSLPSNLVSNNQLRVSQRALSNANDSVSAAQSGTWQVDVNSAPVIRTARKRWREEFTGSNLSSNDWTSSTGTGQFTSVSGSELQVNLGVATNSETSLTTVQSFNIPCRIQVAVRLSQRIANQEIYIELVDKFANHRVGFMLDGVAATTARTIATNNGQTTGNTSVTINSTASYAILEFEIRATEASYFYKAVDSSNARLLSQTRNRQIPDPNLDYNLQIRTRNLATAPASNTTLFVDYIVIEDIEELQAEIIGGRGATHAASGVGVSILGTPTISGSVTVSSGNLTVNNSSFGASDLASAFTESITALVANSSFPGTTRDTLLTRNTVRMLVQTDQTGTMFIDQSPDGSTWLQTNSIACSSGVTKLEEKCYLRYYRVRYTNAATAQTNFRLYSAMFNIGA